MADSATTKKAKLLFFNKSSAIIRGMSNIKAIRTRLGVTQTELAKGIGCTQGNVGHYERGQGVPPDVAKRLIDYAHGLGHVLTFDDIYMPELSQAPANPAQPATETVATQGA